MERSDKPPLQHSDERISGYLHLMNEALAGRFDDLQCPTCRQQAVSVWFTHPTVDRYFTWFICADCRFHTWAEHAEKPPFFSEDRVSTELQEQDLAMLKRSRFKMPPQRKM